MDFPLALVIVAGSYYLYKGITFYIEGRRVERLGSTVSAYSSEVSRLTREVSVIEDRVDNLAIRSAPNQTQVDEMDKRLKDIENAWAFMQGAKHE